MAFGHGLYLEMTMAKYLICPKCNDDYWGQSKFAQCCGYRFTNDDKQKALGLNDFDFKQWQLKNEGCRVKKQRGKNEKNI